MSEENIEKWFVDQTGEFLGTFVGVDPPAEAIEIAVPPADGRQIWDFAIGGFRDRPVSAAAINLERDRRVDAGFLFGGKRYDFDPASKARVTGAATLAGFAVLAGAQAGDLFWHGGELPFRFIAKDNSENEMDAQTCFAFGQAAAAHEEAHIFAARAIKDMNPIPADYATNESYWP